MSESTSLETARYVIRLEGVPDQFLARLELRSGGADGLEFVTVKLHSDTPAVLRDFKLLWKHPFINTHHKWNPACGVNRCIDVTAGSATQFAPRAAGEGPVFCLYDLNGQNALTFALSDAMHKSELRAGVGEESGILDCHAKLLCETLPPMTDYEVTLRLDTRRLPYHQCLAEITRWWEASYPPCPVPEAALQPVYSTWYSFYQKLSPEKVERQCRLGGELGMGAVIVDDGWQTTDNSRGYAYCGDWEVTPAKFPDFRAHVRRVQAMGVKYVLWFAVPFVGIHTAAFKRFEGKLLDADQKKDWYSLDARYPEVREHLISLYERFVTEYGVDGFKLDFVDCLASPKNLDTSPCAGRDYGSLSGAVDRLMSDINLRLRALKPDIMLEFRQSYVGPVMRKYGNMFRAVDCPHDFASNRVRTLDVRLLAGSTAVHSDMFIWHKDDPVESAALHFAHTLFSVPQVSVMLDEMPGDHIDMIRFYLGFWREHRDVLMGGTLAPQHPEQLYPVVLASNKAKLLAAVYGDAAVRLPAAVPGLLIVVNGTCRNRVTLELGEGLGERDVTVVSCTGKRVDAGRRVFGPGFQSLDIPAAGVALLTR